jgi:hypothetical protein
MRATVTNGDRFDAFDDKNRFSWKPGERKAIKRRANRRFRRTGREA